MLTNICIRKLVLEMSHCVIPKRTKLRVWAHIFLFVGSLQTRNYLQEVLCG